MARSMPSETVIRFDTGDVCRYRHPRIAPSFSSRMVNRKNYELSRSSDESRLALRVIAGLKPTAFLAGNRIQMHDAALAAGAAGCNFKEQRYNPKRPVYFCSVTRPGDVRDAFDLDALISDYERYLRHAPKSALLDVKEEIARVGHRPFSAYLNFGKVEVEHDYWDVPEDPGPGRPGSWARCGLLLGYPVQTTVAYILRDLGLGAFVRCEEAR